MLKNLACVLLVALSVFALTSCGGGKKDSKELYIYNWSEYMPDTIVKQFEQETGIKVIYSTYDSNELMYSKLKLQKGKGYDIVVPSSYYVSKMAKEGLLHEIDHSKLSNLKNMLQGVMNQPYDKGNRYSIPYLWGATIIGYNAKVIKREITSWDDLWLPEFKGKVMLPNDVREVFQMALITLGANPNSTNRADLERAFVKLQKLLPSVRVFNSDSQKQPFINNEVTIGLIWTGELDNAIKINRDIRAVFPKDGAILWVDCVSIPKGAENIENAYKFIDFLMRPEVAKVVAEEFSYSTPNKAALELMSPEVRGNRLMNPTEVDLRAASYQDDIGEAVIMYEEYWERLKTGK
ncbi:spermidine/putrescine ABC transporter substrate-binding protein PotD [Deferribacterales bacterium RsTz2092]